MSSKEIKLADLLDRFAKRVKVGEYDRLPYEDWRILSKQQEVNVVIERVVSHYDHSYYDDYSSYEACISNLKTGALIDTYPGDDGSFGTFLLDIYYEGEQEKMPPKDNQTYSWNSTVDYNNTIGSISYDNTSNYNKATSISLSDTFVTKDELDIALATKEDKKPLEKNKENDKMKGFNFDFGPVKGDVVKMSVYGLAVKNNNGTYVSYNAADGAIVDVDILNFDGSKFLYKMPVAIKDIKVGDIVVHNRIPMFVLGTTTKSLNVVDPVSGEKKEIMLTRSPFGFDFATKIVNFLGNFSADPSNPFGNMWMLMLANEGGANNDLLPLMLMNQNGGAMDPMMMYFMLGNKGGNDSLLPLMFMMKNNAPAITCACGGNCGNHTKTEG